ncbi:MAG: FkbM family methyltransferase [Raineya sp.]
MWKKTKKLIWKILNFLGLGAYVQLFLLSYLKDIGWIRSFHSKQSIDAQGKPIPWFTYSAIHFLEPRLQKSFDVFEYGCGNSTLWFAQRVGNIDAVEGDKTWFEKVQKQLPNNAKVVFQEVQEDENGNYAKAITTTQKLYDLVIVDGRDRNNCIKNAQKYLKETGVLILDNADRPEYQDGINFMLEKGYKKIDFIGMPPIVAMRSCTSVFYRKENCLYI